jgi:SAM-dependent methyltransferase
MIYQAKPVRHVDIGSRFDGFVAHVASYREIEVIDIRPIQAVIPGVVFMRMDMMSSKVTMENYCDSISCLHALEHFGLGRYGDPLDPEGHVKGLQNIAKLLKLSGRLYLSVPVGVERIEFNANRVFCPERVVELAKKTGFVLEGLAWIAKDQPVVESTDPLTDIRLLKKMHYALGIFVFTKQSELKFPKY